jgi:hypothetical protein
MAVQADGCSTSRALPDPYVAEDPQAPTPLAQMAHFLPAITLGLDVRIFGQADNVAPAEFVQTIQKRITGVDAVSQERDRTLRWNDLVKTLQQGSGIISPRSISRIDHKTEW